MEGEMLHPDDQNALRDDQHWDTTNGEDTLKDSTTSKTAQEPDNATKQLGEVSEPTSKDVLITEEDMQHQQKKTNVLLVENRRLRVKLGKAKAQNESLTQKHNFVHESLKVMEDKLTQQIEITSGLRGELDDIRRN